MLFQSYLTNICLKYCTMNPWPVVQADNMAPTFWSSAYTKDNKKSRECVIKIRVL